MSRASPVVSIQPDQGGSVQVDAAGWWPLDILRTALRSMEELMSIRVYDEYFKVGPPGSEFSRREPVV